MVRRVQARGAAGAGAGTAVAIAISMGQRQAFIFCPAPQTGDAHSSSVTFAPHSGYLRGYWPHRSDQRLTPSGDSYCHAHRPTMDTPSTSPRSSSLLALWSPRLLSVPRAASAFLFIAHG